MAAENVTDWISGNAMIDLVSRPVSHGMKLREFIPDAGTTISLRNDLPSHLCWGTSEHCGMLHSTSGACHLSSALRHYLVASAIVAKSAMHRKFGYNAYAAGIERLLAQV
ncbi:hypothetical protein JCGZ_19135 [Jatropha curcas]|uniref:Uncharacterized protein n=1 Tax=Jatropha curcas TaxID=180498 RepID=A0A067K3G8_JATCU|nr:hypothetical protein JCGZ_19135 [Jatropha curcas]